MISVDTYLKNLFNNISLDINSVLSKRDARILQTLTLTLSMSTSNYITVRQGQLILKILKENYNALVTIDSSIDQVLSSTFWDNPLRIVEQIRKLYIGIDSSTDIPMIMIEFTGSSSLRKKIFDLSPKVTGITISKDEKCYSADLSESNVVSLIDELSPLGFEVNEKLLSYYNTITQWKEEDFKNQYKITTITNLNFRKQLVNDLGIDTPLTDNLIKDRSLRFQYYVDKSITDTSSLTEVIANRESTRIWIDRNVHTLSNVFESLKELKRLPTLVVFESIDSKKCTAELKNLYNALVHNNINSNVGIYFRLSSDTGSEFNQFISDHSYNHYLDVTTNIVGIQTNKLPKFLMKTDWKPMSVITIGNTLKNTKTSVYANCCDLVISYTDTPPLIESKVLWA